MAVQGIRETPLFDAVHADRRAAWCSRRHLRIAPETVVCHDGGEPIYMDDVVNLRLVGYWHGHVSDSSDALAFHI